MTDDIGAVVATYEPGRTVVLGVDPAITTTGYGVLVGGKMIHCGKISTLAGVPEPIRLWSITMGLVDVIRQYGVSHMAVEEFSAFYRSHKKPEMVGGALPNLSGHERHGAHDREMPNPTSMFLMKGAQSAAQMAGLLTGVELFLYKVAEWKGGNRVTKDQVRQLAKTIYGVPGRDHNVTDAVMIAHHHVVRGRLTPGKGVQVPEEIRQELLGMLTIGGPNSGRIDNSLHVSGAQDHATQDEPDIEQPVIKKTRSSGRKL